MPGDGPAHTLRREGLRPRKRLGQNFLRDSTFLPKIVAAADVDCTDEVLEVGAGTGILTEALAERAARVVAVELDERLYRALARRFQGLPDVLLVHENALAFEPCGHFSGPYKLVANIPYYITGLLVRKYLEATCQPIRLVLMVQREVAQRMAAGPGDLSMLGVSVQYYAQVQVVARVPAGAFYPVPKVDSAIVVLKPYRTARASAGAEAFFKLARAGFGVRRKQLQNALAAGTDMGREEARALLLAAGVDPTERAERLTIADWERLAARSLERG